MILILSVDGDRSTESVIDCLVSFNYPYLRINSSDFIDKKFFFNLSKGLFVFGDNKINLSDIKAVWFRKFHFFYTSIFHDQAAQATQVGNVIPFIGLESEFTAIINSFIFYLKDKNWLTNPKKIFLNKLAVLKEAQNLGLNTPETFLINTKDDLLKIPFGLISKSVKDASIVRTGKGFYSMFTSKIDKELIPEKFFTSMVQEFIEKELDLRVFFLENEFYTMAIFSQFDMQTKTDFRNYNNSNPNQVCRYNLPKNISNMLLKLVNQLELNCCSIDLVKDRNGEYYFLEINPLGQFGMVSIPCNYNLEKKVAEYLIKLDK